MKVNETLAELRETLVGLDETLPEPTETLVGSEKSLVGSDETLIESEETLVDPVEGRDRQAARVEEIHEGDLSRRRPKKGRAEGTSPRCNVCSG